MNKGANDAMDKELDQYFEDYDVETIDNEEDYREKAAMVAEKLEGKLKQASGKIRFAQDILALFRFFRDPGVPWQKKAIVLAALAYFITPFDAIPDLAPFVGYLDDMGVIAAVIKFMSSELQPYYPEEPTEQDIIEQASGAAVQN
ncbi:MAG: hypothetical protein CL946_08770 [Ectothiorhodospiraceae bacterium]|nr:hypothetical protein [Ectothiorhodospiraceae bacterium]